MDIANLKYYATRTLLTFLGPADLEDHADPRQRLIRERAERKGTAVTATPAPAVAAVGAAAEPAPKAIA